MSDAAALDPAAAATTPNPHPPPIPIDKSPPRPAPTYAYSWAENNPNARLFYTRNHQEANRELAKLGPGPYALGFDLEWKPTYVKGAPENRVALVQLANNDTVFLLQVSAMQDFPAKLAEILRDPLVVKTGVGIQGDAQKLYNDFHVNMSSCVDLTLLARTVDNARWQGKYSTSLGLARLVESYEYRILLKGKITRSNWEAHLNPAQQEYAANDAHAGYALYRRFVAMIPALPQPPDIRWFSFNVLSGQLLGPDGFQWHAVNPNYDPGPPPPPKREKPPRPRKVKKDDATEPSEIVLDEEDAANNKRKADHDNNSRTQPPKNYNGGVGRNSDQLPARGRPTRGYPAGPSSSTRHGNYSNRGGSDNAPGPASNDRANHRPGPGRGHGHSGQYFGQRNSLQSNFSSGRDNSWNRGYTSTEQAQSFGDPSQYTVQTTEPASRAQPRGRGGRPYRGNRHNNNSSSNPSAPYIEPRSPRGQTHAPSQSNPQASQSTTVATAPPLPLAHP